MHSTAVDYPKTGVPAKWAQEPLHPKRWPHFMEKRNSYRSRKALGQLYDRVAHEDTGFQPRCEDIFDRRVIQKYEHSETTLAEAKEIKAQYDFAVRRLLKQHRVGTEFELYSGWAMSRPAVGSDYKRQEVLGHEFDAMKDRFRDVCYEAAGGLTPELLDPFVAAMYKVTEDEVTAALRGDGDDDVDVDAEPASYRRNPLISFPWIFHWILIRIAVGNDYKPSECALAAARRKIPLKLSQAVPAPTTQEAKVGQEKPAVEELISLDEGCDGIQENVRDRLDGITEMTSGSDVARAVGDEENVEEQIGEEQQMSERSTNMPPMLTRLGNGEDEEKKSAVDRLMKLMGYDSDEDE